MLSYEVSGNLLRLVARGALTEDERRHCYSAIRNDARVPDEAVMLIDATRLDEPPVEEVPRNTRLMIEQLGRKLGRTCAVLVPPRLAPAAGVFKHVASALGLDVALFRDETAAHDWLRLPR